MPLNDDQYQRLLADFADVFTKEEVDQRIEEALAHKAARKYLVEYLYLRNWLRRDAEYRRERKSLSNGNGQTIARQAEEWRQRRANGERFKNGRWTR